MRLGHPSELPADEWPEFIVVFEPDLQKKLQALPKSEQVWVGARRKTGVIVAGGTLDAVIWVEADSTEILAFEEAKTGWEPTAILDCLYWAMIEPHEGKPRKPALVQVNDLKLVDNLRPCLEPLGIEIQYSALTESVDKAFKRCKFVNRDHVHAN